MSLLSPCTTKSIRSSSLPVSRTSFTKNRWKSIAASWCSNVRKTNCGYLRSVRLLLRATLRNCDVPFRPARTPWLSQCVSCMHFANSLVWDKKHLPNALPQSSSGKRKWPRRKLCVFNESSDFHKSIGNHFLIITVVRHRRQSARPCSKFSWSARRRNRRRWLHPRWRTSALRARPRWLLRLGMDWKICPFSEHPDGNIINVALNVSVTRKCFPAKCRWHGRQWDPRHFFPLPDEVRRWSPKEFARHVVLSVGTTIFQKILKSMTKELTTLAPFTMMVPVTASPEWKYLVCMGECSCFCTHPRVRFECVQSLSGCCARCLMQFRSSFSLLSSIIETVAGQACTV